MKKKKNKVILSDIEKNKINQINKLNKPHKGDIVQNNNHGYIFELTNVEKTYTNGYFVNDVLKNINLSIVKGHFVVILGKSGSGKTTLLNIISGMTRATKGSVVVNNHQLINMSNSQLTNFRRNYIGYIFQEYGLLNTLNVYENVMTGFVLNKANKNKDEIDEILKWVGLSDHKKKYPYELSGGQQQRVAIARTIAKKPLIIFGDEPTGALDSQMSKNVLQLLQKINKEFNTTIVLITHDENIAKIANHVIVVENGNIKENFINENPEEA